MAQSLHITRGIPASGKTTWALAWVEEDPKNRARVNRDEMRSALFGKYVLDGDSEEAVTIAQRAAVKALIRARRSVVVDDTNLRLRTVKDWADFAAEENVEFHVHDFFEVGIDECISRDRARRDNGGRYVGEQIIRDFHKKYLSRNGGTLLPVQSFASAHPKIYTPDRDLMAAWIFDIDGTLALMDGRGPFDWSRVGEDKPNRPVHDLVSMIDYAGDVILVVSGRDGSCRAQTEQWLQQHNVPYWALHMREANDNRRDSIVKQEIFWRDIAPLYNVLGVFDDRNQVVDMWRSMGLFCAQVAPGDF